MEVKFFFVVFAIFFVLKGRREAMRAFDLSSSFSLCLSV